MQLSFYLDEKTARALDRKARRLGRSRSAYIQTLLKRDLQLKGRELSPWHKAVGLFKRQSPEKLIRLIRLSRVNKKW